MSNIPILILLIIVFPHSSSQICSGFHLEDHLQSGKHAFLVNPQGISSVQKYQTQIYYPIPSHGYEAIASTSMIDSNSEDGFDFEIQTEVQNGKNYVVFSLEIQKNMRWSSIQISYLISSRLDLYLGTFISFDNRENETTSFKEEEERIISKDISEFLPTNFSLTVEDHHVITFISGVSSTDGKFNLIRSKDDIFVKNQSLLLQFSIKGQFEKIVFSFIVYPKKHSVFTIVQDASPKGNGSYQISGLTAVTKTRLQYKEFRIENRMVFCEGKACPSICLPKQKCEQFSGHLYQNKCFICAEDDLFQAGVCRFGCAVNEIWVFDRICICKSGYKRVNKKCALQCRQDQEFKNGKCICLEGFYENDGKCEELPKCPNATLWNSEQKKCDCIESGFFLVKENCEKCTTFCKQCESLSSCQLCQDGFMIYSDSFGDENISFCVEVCGDGRNFQLSCDDQNNISGDGCSAECFIEKGWQCTSSNMTHPSICEKIKNGVKLINGGFVHLNKNIFQQIFVQNLPQCALSNNCEKCDSLLQVKVDSSSEIKEVIVSYISQRFIIEIFGSEASGQMELSVKLNQTLKECFSEQDLAQEIKFKIQYGSE